TFTITINDPVAEIYNVDVTATSVLSPLVTDTSSTSTTFVIPAPIGQTVINSTINGTLYASEFWYNILNIFNSATIYYTNVTGLSVINNITNSTVYSSNIANSSILNSNLNGCTVINSTVAKVIASAPCSFINTYVDPINSTGSIIIGGIMIASDGSNVTYSNVTNSDINGSTNINNAVINNAVINNNNISAGTITINGNFYNANLRGNMSILRIANNIAPVANAGPDQGFNNGTLVILSGSAYDANGDFPLKYNWTQASGSSVIILSDPTILNPTFSTQITGSYVFMLTADDGITNNSDSVTISVSIPGTTPPEGSGGGGGGSPGVVICKDIHFSCGNWTNCSINGTMTRICEMITKCQGGMKPLETQSCLYFPKEEIETPVIVNETDNTNKITGNTIMIGSLELDKNVVLYGGIASGIILLLLIAYGIYRLTRPKVIEHKLDNKAAKEFVKKKKK
ncbi:MAG: hypothetical protein KJ623_04555, partial [Nanoarchaeota archaeon]|nr:hypothetical protein [Nanoarchaeota archaeon]